MLFIMYNCLFIIEMFVAADGQTYSEMDALLEHLFNKSRYNKLIRPLHNQSHVMKVNFTQYLKRIEDFDISSGELTSSEYFEISWIDELLNWNPSMYGGKEIIPLAQGQFWKPEFAIRNGAANEKSIIYETGVSQAWATYQGSVILIPTGSYTTRCDVDTTSFPFDKHECSSQFVLTNHDSTEVMLYSPTGDLDTRNLDENGEWVIQNTDAKIVLLRDENIDILEIPMVYASFSIKRRPLFELINNYFPVGLMCLLNLFTCFVRSDSGERLSFAVTLYLSLVFSTTATTEKIPNNSLKLPLMSYIILILNLINTTGVLWSIFIVHLENTTLIHWRLPNFVLKMIMKNKHKEMCEYKDKIQPGNSTQPEVKCQEDEYTDIITSEERGQTNKETTLADKVTGHELAIVFDKIYFCFVAFFLFILNAVFLFGIFRS